MKSLLCSGITHDYENTCGDIKHSNLFRTDDFSLNTLFLNKKRNIFHNIIVSLRLAIPKTPYIINSLSSNN